MWVDIITRWKNERMMEAYLLLGLALLLLLSTLLLLTLAFLEQRLRDEDLVLGWHAPTPVSVGPLRWTTSPWQRIAAQWSAGSHAFFAGF